jgi:hypothetical protein
MKYTIVCIVLLSILALSTGCKKDENNPAAPTVVATEEWGFIMNNDSSNHGQTIFEKKSDGSTSGKAVWYFDYLNSQVQCPFEGGSVTVADTAITVTAKGTATNSAAPTGYQTSAFTVQVTGSAYNGLSYGTWSISFTTLGWPMSLSGTFTATRISGNGITK